MRQLAALRASERSPLLQVLKTSVAAILAWVISALLLGQPLPIFAAIAALLVVQPSVNQSLAKGIERSIGVILGVVLAYLAGLAFGNASWVVLAVIVVSLLLAWALKLTPGSSNQIPISAMLVLAIGAQSPAYAVDRILETFIGAAVGLIVNAIIVPPVLVAPARLAVGRLAASVAAALERLSRALVEETDAAERHTLLVKARELRPLLDQAERAIDSAEESLTFNPRAGRHRVVIEQDRAMLARLRALVVRTLGMTRSVHDHYDAPAATDPIIRGIATELDRAAHDVRLMTRTAADDSEPSPVTDLPALTAPLVIARPDPRHWVLVGSLMEDLRRVREEIRGEPDA